MDTFKLPYSRVKRVSEETDEYLALDVGTNDTADRIFFHDIISVIKAPRENGFVESEYLLLSVQQAAKDAEAPSATEDYSLKINILQTLPDSLQRYSLPRLPAHLTLPREDLHIVISTLSGACEAERFCQSLVQPTLSLLGITNQSYAVHHTNSDHTIADLAKEIWGPRANEGRQQTVLLLSGDGGIVDTINGVRVSNPLPEYVKPIVGLIALGTGNAMANSCGLNSDSTKGLSSFLRGSPRPVPTFEAKFSPGAVLLTHEGSKEEPLPKNEAGYGNLHGAVVASWGVHASLVADSDTAEYRKYGSDRFGMAARALMAPPDGSDPHVYRGEVTLFKADGKGKEHIEHWDRNHHIYFVAVLVSNLEKALTISPKSRPLDGQLRLVHFGELSGTEVMQIFARAFDGGKHVDMDAVGYDAIDGMRVDFNESEGHWRRVCIDGKIVKVEGNGWVEVRKEKDSFLHLIIP
ncbi:MAG: hypothetical protein MMC23_000186 [Stictis urceolatum]|nr:hypothetical protein [Stictis urceolata]